MRFGLLGTLEVIDDDGRAVDLGGSQPRAVLGMLLVANGRIVSVDAVVEALWGDSPPASAAGTLQSYVSRLRRTLEPDRPKGEESKLLVWEPPGYRFSADLEAVDAWRFERLADDGRALLDAGRVDEARNALVEAESLWRGPALLDLRDLDFASGVAARLDERRLAAQEDRFDADLRLGRHGAAVSELTEAVAAHPLREGLRSHLALALYRSGRQAEALRAIDEARRVLREELGIDPGRPLRELEARILDHDPDLDVPTRAIGSVENGGVPSTTAGHPDGKRSAAVPASTLVGRDVELGHLLDAYAEAVSGGVARVVVVEGEPGIGKTRLVEELGDRLADDATVVWGRCYEGEAAPAFWPWLAAVRGLVDAAGLAASPELEQFLTPAAEVNPFTTGGGRFALYDAVAAALATAAANRPVVVALDDIQWADHASLELLAFIAGATADGRLLLIATIRDLDVGRSDALVDTLASISRRPGSRRIALHGLHPDQTAELLREATGGAVNEPVAIAIHARAEGNPFYATELARLIGQEGDLDDPRAVRSAAIPAGVRDVIRQRLARLPAPTAELLRVAAVIGRDLDLGLLARAADRGIDECIDELDAAVVQRLVGPALDRPDAFRFVHALVREVLVDDLSSLRRARLHLRVADAIAEQYGDMPDAAEILAEHLWSAAPVGVGRRAAEALDRAAEVAIRRMAYEAGEHLLTRAVQLFRSVAGNSREELSAELVCVTHLLALRRALHGYNALLSEGALIDRTRELARRAGREDVLARMLWAEWAAFDTACDLARSAPIAEEIRALARTATDRTTQVMGLQAWGIHCWHLGRITEASEHLDAASELSQQVDGSELAIDFEHEQELLPQPFAVYVHDLVGDLDDIPERFAALGAARDHPFAKSVVQMFATAGALAVGDFARAAAEARKGLEGDPDLAFTFWGCGTQAYLGCALALTGSLDEGVAMVRSALPRFLESGARTGLPIFHARLAQAFARAGQFDEADASMRETEETLAAYTEAWAAPIAIAVDAEIRHHRGDDPDEVAARFREAVDLATRQGAHGVAAGITSTIEELGLS